MKSNIDHSFSSEYFPNMDELLQTLAKKKRGEYISIEYFIAETWQMILSGLPYVIPDKTGQYLLNQARCFKKLIDTSQPAEKKFELSDITKLLDMGVGFKDHSLRDRSSFISPHNTNVARYARAVSKSLGFQEGDIEKIEFSASIHDIGKIAVPDYVLSKPDKLTKEEFEMVKPHALVGGKMLKVMSCIFKLPMERTIQEVESHHEKYNGEGYPRGLYGNNIPFGAQIISICDVFDALTSERPYRMPYKNPLEALEEMAKDSGEHFNNDLLEHSYNPLQKTFFEIHTVQQN